MKPIYNITKDQTFVMGFVYRLGYECGLKDLACDAQFKENDHPRDKNGQFTKSAQSTKTIEEIYGNEITGLHLTGRKAINAVLKQESGHVKGAFYRKGIGAIDVIWGNKKVGLKHILESRKKNGQTVADVLDAISDVISKGQIIKENDPFRTLNTYRFELWRQGKGYRVIVTKYATNSLNTNNHLHYVLTGMKIKNERQWQITKKK